MYGSVPSGSVSSAARPVQEDDCQLDLSSKWFPRTRGEAKEEHTRKIGDGAGELVEHDDGADVVDEGINATMWNGLVVVVADT